MSSPGVGTPAHTRGASHVLGLVTVRSQCQPLGCWKGARSEHTLVAIEPASVVSCTWWLSDTDR